ncbi:MAG: protein-export chaperone SecB [Steroidobacteraceae bacterium]|jgi:preprotein translocase subunit SecB|nr:protein-export chaperone SecB [Steroidobacteraceae bacterium]
MADENNAGAPADTQPGAAPNQPEMVLQNIYVKDASFEAPAGPNIPVDKWNPQFGLNMNTAGTTVAQDMHEVVLTITLEAKLADKTAYLCEVKQAGIFLVRGYSTEEARRIIGAFCPSVLFPYARQAISDMITRGGFPPFLLPPVNFDALFLQSLQQAQQQQAAAPQPAVN